MRGKRIAALLLSLLLLLAGCAPAKPSEESKAGTSGVPETDPQEKTEMKSAELILSPGQWDCTSSDPFTVESLQGAFATRRFTPDQLPEGSVLSVADGIVLTVEGWKNFPKPEKTPLLVTDGKAAEIAVTSALLGETSSVAFSLKAAEGTLTAARAEEGFRVSVPLDAPDRRTMTWNDDETLSILTVGNSFSDDAMEYVYDIAKSAGVKKVVLGNLFYSACHVQWHYRFWAMNEAVYEYRVNDSGKWVTTKNARFDAAFGTTEWDFISFQESAQVVQTDASLYKHLSDLIAMAKERCPGAKIVWHQPWANPHANYGGSTEKMFLDCLAASRKIAEPYGFDEIINTGTAIQNLRTSFVDNDTRILRDGWHLSLDLGRYTAGLTFFSMITGIDVSGIAFAPNGVSKEEKAAAVESAVNAARRPRIVTQSVYTADPMKEKLSRLGTDYELLDAEWTVGYWNAASSSGYDASSAFAQNFLRSKLFTKDTLPAGTIILVENGCKCRPEGWYTYPKTLPDASRAAFLTTGSGIVYEVPEDWFDVYTTRAFNISVADGSGKSISALPACVKIYVPKTED